MGSVQPPSLAKKTVQEWRVTCCEKAKVHRVPPLLLGSVHLH